MFLQSPPVVSVLLATYNGELFLEEQLQSLKNQIGVAVQVFANDDGSSDRTLEILRKWKVDGLIKGISHSSGAGSTKAFLTLLFENADSEFVAFCDQDDVWDAEKLLKQIKSVRSNQPTLVFTNRDLLMGNQIVPFKVHNRKIIANFQNALVENIAYGNTILLNRNAVALVKEFKNHVPVHYDAWLYLIMSALGELVHIEVSLVHYRIHSDNLVGLRSGLNYSIYDSIGNYFKNASALQESCNQRLTPQNRTYLSKFVSVVDEKAKFRAVLVITKMKLFRQKKIHSIGFKVLTIIGLLFKKFEEVN